MSKKYFKENDVQYVLILRPLSSLRTTEIKTLRAFASLVRHYFPNKSEQSLINLVPKVPDWDKRSPYESNVFEAKELTFQALNKLNTKLEEKYAAKFVIISDYAPR